MSALPACFPTLLAAWNEHDPVKMRHLVEAALTPDVAFTDPNYQIIGIDAFIDQVNDFRAAEGKARLVPTSGVDMHHNRARYAWAVLRTDGTRFDGFDVVEIDPVQGKIKRIDGFFGALPAMGTNQIA
jgi:hypothetical protein